MTPDEELAGLPARPGLRGGDLAAKGLGGGLGHAVRIGSLLLVFLVLEGTVL